MWPLNPSLVLRWYNCCPQVSVPNGWPLYFSAACERRSNGGHSEQERIRLTPLFPCPSLFVLRQCPRREGHHDLNGVPNSPHKGMVGARPLWGSGSASGSHRRGGARHMKGWQERRVSHKLCLFAFMLRRSMSLSCLYNKYEATASTRLA